MADGTKIFRAKPYREFVINVAVYEVVENPDCFDPFRIPTLVPPPKYKRIKIAESEGGRAFGTLELLQVRAQDLKNQAEIGDRLPKGLGFMGWVAENLKVCIHRIILDRDDGIAPRVKEHLERNPS
jgi:hypothetical protein